MRNTHALLAVDLRLPLVCQTGTGTVGAQPTVAPRPSEPRLSQIRADSATSDDVDARRGQTRGIVAELVAEAARVLAKQSHFPRMQVAASLVAALMNIIEKRRTVCLQDVDESRATCLSMVNMLQRAEDVLAKGNTNVKTESDLIADVYEAVADLVGLMKTYQSKNALSKVAEVPIFKQRLRDAEAVVDLAFDKLNVSLVVILIMFCYSYGVKPAQFR